MFLNLFAACDEETSQLTITDIPKDTFEIFYNYLYTDRIPNLPVTKAQQVLIIADKYDVQTLKNICDDMIINQLEEGDPVHEIFQMAHAYDCSRRLKEVAFRFVQT